MNKTAALFIDAVSKYKAIAIYIPGSPDPDAIASAYAVKLILSQLSIEADIFAEKRLSLSQNRVFIDRLNIPVYFGKEINVKKYGAYIVTDFQDNRVENISELLPCAAHIDHHGKSDGTVKADFSLIRTDAGSTSTLVALIVKNTDIVFPEEDITTMATALIFGIQTDTDKYNNITPLDVEALSYLTDFADRSMLQSISRIPTSPKTFSFFHKAKNNEVVYRGWGFYGLGYIDGENRDSMAMVADMVLKSSDHKTVAVFALVEDHKKGDLYLDVSLRSSRRGVDLNRVIKRITPNGGGRRYKGAYQVNLNYFLNAPDRDMLWKVVEATTIETLRKSRDTHYITEIESIYSGIKDKLLSLLKKDSEM